MVTKAKSSSPIPSRTSSPAKSSPARNMAVGAPKGSVLRGKESPVSYKKG